MVQNGRLPITVGGSTRRRHGNQITRAQQSDLAHWGDLGFGAESPA
jgi:hypothetical protein